MHTNGVPVVRVSSEDELAPLVEGTLMGHAVRTRTDCAALHAASVQCDGRGLLMPGGKGSGKSTLALCLAESGCTYLSDEVAFVRFDDAGLEAFPKAVTLKEGSFGLFPDCRTCSDPVRGPVRYHVPRHRADAANGACAVDSIIFPLYDAGASRISVSTLQPEQLAALLVRQCFDGLERSPRTLDLLGRLSARPGYCIEYPHARAAARVVRELTAE